MTVVMMLFDKNDNAIKNIQVSSTADIPQIGDAIALEGFPVATVLKRRFRHIERPDSSTDVDVTLLLDLDLQSLPRG